MPLRLRTKRKQRKTAVKETIKAQIDTAALLYKPLNARNKKVRLLTIIPSEFAAHYLT
jgi:hypothetical protein